MELLDLLTVMRAMVCGGVVARRVISV